MKADLKSQYRKLSVKSYFTVIFALFVFAFFMSACSTKPKDKGSVEVQEPTIPLQAYNGEFLYGDIPAPIGVDVFIFSNSADEEYNHYSFSFENFTLQNAKEYIALLEESVVEKREAYDVYTENDYPILNYFGWLKDGSAITLSQCNTSGGIMINVKKSK